MRYLVYTGSNFAEKYVVTEAELGEEGGGGGGREEVGGGGVREGEECLQHKKDLHRQNTDYTDISI